jgi:hypothetical protein
LLEALVVAYFRAGAGVATRYSTTSIVFIAATLALVWRASSFGYQSRAIRVGVLAGALFCILFSNASIYETVWRRQIAVLDNATAKFRKGEFPSDRIEDVMGPFSSRADALMRLKELHVGPF